MCHEVVFCILIICGYSAASNDPPGHLQPLGSHMAPIEIEVTEAVPDPVEFFNKYVKPSKPVIMRGAAKVFNNFDTWKNDDYLRRKYGNWFVSVEIGKYEGSVFGTHVEVPFRKFIDEYKSKEYYLIQDITRQNSMRDEISLLKAMACGGYADQVSSVMLFFSSGSTQSALHWDGIENMHCVLDGTKEWIMFDRKFIPRLPKLENQTAYAAMDCRSVDMYRYPVVQELPWHHAYLEAGDCLFVPHSWPHHVKSSGNKRNMALAIWFGPMCNLNISDCPDAKIDIPDSVPVGRQRMSKLNYVKSMMLTLFDEHYEDLSREKFLEKASNHADEKEILSTYEALDSNKDGFISVKEVEIITEETIKKFSIVDEDMEKYDEIWKNDDRTPHEEF